MRMPEKERYKYLRERKRCARCGKQDARTLGGFAYCDPCAEKVRIRNNSDKYKELNKQKRIYNSARGICTKCGKNKPSEGYRICDKCREYAAVMYRKKCLRKMQESGEEKVGTE